MKLLLVVLAACTSPLEPEPPAPRAAAPAHATAVIPGFDLSPREGDFWQFEEARTWRGATTTTRYRLVLGPGEERDGRLVFPLRREGGAAPWPYVAFDRRGLSVSKDARTFVPVFDAWTGVWSGAGGFFARGNGAAFEAESILWNGRLAYRTFPTSGHAIVVNETFLPGIGPAGLESLACGTDCLQISITLLAASVGGRTLGEPHAPCHAPSDCEPRAECVSIAGIADRCRATCDADADCPDARCLGGNCYLACEGGCPAGMACTTTDAGEVCL